MKEHFILPNGSELGMVCATNISKMPVARDPIWRSESSLEVPEFFLHSCAHFISPTDSHSLPSMWLDPCGNEGSKPIKGNIRVPSAAAVSIHGNICWMISSGCSSFIIDPIHNNRIQISRFLSGIWGGTDHGLGGFS